MSGSEGFTSWGRTFYAPDGRVWLGGRQVNGWHEVEEGAVTWRADNGIRILTTHAGTNILQSAYRGSAAPLYFSRKAFTTGFLADDEDDYLAFLRQESLGDARQFFPGMWEVETFRAASAGSFTLRRDPGPSVISELDPLLYPTTVLLDGIATPSAATVMGRTVAVSVSGDISIEYAPAYSVVLQDVSQSLGGVNQLVVTCSLVEVRQGSA